jgi:hypothetical protein
LHNLIKIDLAEKERKKVMVEVKDEVIPEENLDLGQVGFSFSRNCILLSWL